MASESPNRLFVVCVDDAGVEDVSCGVVYQVLPDLKAASEGFLRIVDDSGEDYLYPRERFVAIDVPDADSERLFAVCSPR